MQEQDELKELIAEQEGRIANEAADSSLKLLCLLGAMEGEATALYRSEGLRRAGEGPDGDGGRQALHRGGDG